MKDEKHKREGQTGAPAKNPEQDPARDSGKHSSKDSRQDRLKLALRAKSQAAKIAGTGARQFHGCVFCF